jgi:RHS repeat-associated protein
MKYSEPIVPHHWDAGRQYHRTETERLRQELKLGLTFYGWEGNRLVWESTKKQSVHYFYEPGSFAPLAMGVKNHSIRVHEAPDWTNRTYRMADDPLWTKALQPEAFDHLYFYHCDQIGTPLEMTDEQGNTVWRAEYKAWGEAMLVTEKVRNPLRFQGQYFDHETGLHYNHFRYYDPQIGRYISKDPIGLAGGLNPYAYAPNPTGWVDPLGLFEICKRNLFGQNEGENYYILTTGHGKAYLYLEKYGPNPSKIGKVVKEGKKAASRNESCVGHHDAENEIEAKLCDASIVRPFLENRNIDSGSMVASSDHISEDGILPLVEELEIELNKTKQEKACLAQYGGNLSTLVNSLKERK